MTSVYDSKQLVTNAKANLKNSGEELKNAFKELKKSYEGVLEHAHKEGKLTKIDHGLYSLDDIAVFKVGSTGGNQSLGMYMDYEIQVSAGCHSKSEGVWYGLNQKPVNRSPFQGFLDNDIQKLNRVKVICEYLSSIS